MIAYAAIDLSEGRAVQWIGGRREQQRVALPDPVSIARKWVDLGFKALHVIDLDAATGNGSNREEVRAILSAASVPVQVGGGVRDEKAAAELLADGSSSVIVGTRAIRDPAWLEALSSRHPGQVTVAADIRDRGVVVAGWSRTTGLPVEEILARLEPLPLAGVLVTDVGREGRLQGIDASLFGDLASITRHRVLAAGGITTAADLAGLAGAGIAGAVIGMALYTGALDPASIAREYAE